MEMKFIMSIYHQSIDEPSRSLQQNSQLSESNRMKLQGRILVVDDSCDGRAVICKVLKCMGLTVESAENGLDGCQTALAALENCQPFDLILMDMHMPIMDGYSATAYLREVGYNGRIAALTADSNQGVREQCMLAGCDDFANKPISLEKLFHLAQRNIHPNTLAVRPLIQPMTTLTELL
jgi:CheY-like chemotaxis protein